MLQRIIVASSRIRADVKPLVGLLRNLPVQQAFLVHCVESVLPGHREIRRHCRVHELRCSAGWRRYACRLTYRSSR